MNRTGQLSLVFPSVYEKKGEEHKMCQPSEGKTKKN